MMADPRYALETLQGVGPKRAAMLRAAGLTDIKSLAMLTDDQRRLLARQRTVSGDPCAHGQTALLLIESHGLERRGRERFAMLKGEG
jgi:hypothetical protein